MPARTWLDPGLYTLFWNTFVYVAGSTAVGITLAAVLAWLAERSDMPGKIWIYAGVPMTLAIPGMLQAMAWILLLSPRVGFLNKAIADASSGIWWTGVYPGTAIVLTVLGLTLVGESINDLNDPRLRGRKKAVAGKGGPDSTAGTQAAPEAEAEAEVRLP